MRWPDHSRISSSSTKSVFSDYRCTVRKCGRAGCLQEGQQIHALLVKNGIASSPSAFIHNALLYMYAACASVSAARQAFQQIPHTHRDIVDWTTLMSCYARNSLPAQALDLFLTMMQQQQQEQGNKGEEGPYSSSVRPDEVTMVCLFSACAQLRDPIAGAQAHLFIIKTGLPFTLTSRNAAMDMYAKCSCISDARQMLEEMTDPTIVSWTIILYGTLTIEGVNSARQVFDGMREKNEVAWTVMITGYVEAGLPREAMSLLAQMIFSYNSSFLTLNHVTLCSLLSACSQSGDLTIGRWIHAHAVKMMEEERHPLLMVGTALVNMYCKCGRLDRAVIVFNKMPQRNVVAWNAMMSGLAMHGQGHAALSLFSQMAVEAQPDDITLVAVLSACSHSGLVDQGRQYFSDLWSVYAIVPKVEHYACMVDLLGRAGQLEEAEALIREMPIRPNEVVLGSLLGSCSLHGKLELGERLLRELVQMDPLNTQYHMLLSNMYASAGRQDKAYALRKMLKSRGIRKVPGMSFIHVGGQVHRFTAGDKMHPQTQDVYSMLDEITRRLRLAGYVPNNCSQIFHFNLMDGSMDEQEEVEQSLFTHSERLAISFGLVSTKDGVPLHIFKNLRICRDCHTAIKLISDIFNREITVRDRNRFHSFKKGSCSCSDYW
ncbi:pentatricopeptide repeat-containing protein At5g15340, mitochondrial [Magnolia sinica]|uniref:pentatricopeptide repeat-containing protein At5g15340, mitochondrial n=1 Tax=Magnolia sinica TaxID=86752 RepID=UPI00265A1CDD|nr:pentatricopeptide repeat-containing protein At5g15340, mitochondrial [Magnolia sinica]